MSAAFAGLRVVDSGLGDRERATLALLAQALTGARPAWLEVPAGLPEGLDPARRRTWQAFTATPAPLLESWRVARHLEAATRPGDVILVSDRDGRGGVFALEQAGRPAEERRRVVVAAADSAVLEYAAVAGTIDGAEGDVVAVMDWELVAYRHAALVAATSQLAVDILADLGVAATVAVAPGAGEGPAVPDGPPRRVALPEPVSRLSGSGILLRGLSGALDRVPALEIAVSKEDRTDHLFTGTTWDTLAGVRGLLGPRITRHAEPDGDLVLLGDPFAAPPPAVAAARRRGTLVAVRAGSCAAALWPNAPTWQDERGVVAVVSGPSPVPSSGPPAAAPAPATPAGDPDRARRVSVGVPVFGDPRFLDDCLRSIVSQDEPPHEVLIVDDGSRSPAVDEAIGRWEQTHAGLVRGVTQSPNQGVSAARNLALEQMTGDAFVFVDADDELHPRFLAACAGALRADASLWVAAAWTEFFGSYEGIEAKPPFDRRVGLRENTIISTLALVDMKVRDLGLRFAPDLAFLFCEDWELWSRIVAAGGRFGLVPEPLARHRVHVTSGGFQRTDLAIRLGTARATAPLKQ